MAETALAIGAVSIVAAIVGGGLRAAHLGELPVIDSLPRQALLAAFGAAMIAIGLAIDDNNGGNGPPSTPTTATATATPPPEPTEDPTTTAEPEPISAGTLRLTLTDNWADLDEGRVWRSDLSTNLRFATEYDLMLAFSPGGLILWGGLPDAGNEPRLHVIRVGPRQPDRLSCAAEAAGATAGGLPADDLVGAYACMLTTDGNVAEFTVLEIEDDPELAVTIAYRTWSAP